MRSPLTAEDIYALSSIYIKERRFLFPPDKAAPEIMDRIQTLAGSSGIVAYYLEQFYRREGTQLRVTKELSDAMIETDFRTFNLDALLFPSPVLEVVFDDPKLPTCLCGRINGFYIKKHMPFMKEQAMHAPDDVSRFLFVMEATDGRIHTTNSIGTEMLNSMLHGEEIRMVDSSPLEQEETKAMNALAALVLKVIAYCSVPRVKLEDVPKVTRAMGCKPHSNNRPWRPAKLVRMFPTVYTQRTSPEHTEGPKGTRVFRGHRAYIRYFDHARWTNMRYKWIIVPEKRVIDGPIPAVARLVPNSAPKHNETPG